VLIPVAFIVALVRAFNERRKVLFGIFVLFTIMFAYLALPEIISLFGI
jgi:hypothetical protein